MRTTTASIRTLSALLVVLAVAAPCLAKDPLAPLSIEEQRADFDILVGILEEAVPVLYVYRSKGEVDAHFERIRESLDRPRLVSDFLIQLGRALSFVQDGHLRPFIANDFYDATIKKDGYLPLDLKFLDGNVYVLKNLTTSEAPMPGDRVLAINGRNIERILTDLRSFFGSDGDNEEHKRHRMDVEYRLLLSYLFAFPTQYTMTVSRPGLEDGLDVRVEGMSLSSLKSARKKKEGRKAEKHELFSIDWDHRLSVATFRFDTFGDREGEERLREIMTGLVEDCRASGTKTLIVDIRNNTGGFDGNAAVVFSYLTDKPFMPLRGRYLKSKRISFGDYLLNKGIEDQLKSAPTVPRGGEHKLDMMLDRVVQPAASAFTGDIYLLIGSRTFSTAGLFTSIFRNAERGVIVGASAAGGGARGDSGGLAYVMLPNSKIQLHVPLVRNEYIIDDDGPAGDVLEPDHLVPLTIEDVIDGRDRVMKSTLELIGSR